MADAGDDERGRSRLAQPRGHHRDTGIEDDGRSSEDQQREQAPNAILEESRWSHIPTSEEDAASAVGDRQIGLPPLRRSSRTRKAPAVFNAVTMELRGRSATVTGGGRASTALVGTRAAEPHTPTNHRAQRKRGRLCKAEDCDNYIVYNGLCCRHGGGKRCSVSGCGASAKNKGLCWRHGGSTECKVDGCSKKAKAKGVCWSHGGGTQCHHEDCTKIAASKGLCWAHGGGKRCIHDGCQRPAYVRTHSFCEKHFKELQHVDYYEV